MEGEKEEKRFGAVTGNRELWDKEGSPRLIQEAKPLFRDHGGQKCENTNLYLPLTMS